MNVVRAADPGAEAGARVASALAAAADRPFVVLALSGGTSPNPVLDWLPGKLEPALLARLRVTWTDERVVPYGGDWTGWDPALNRRSAHERWFRHLAAPPLEVAPWEGTGTAEAAAERYERRWHAELGGRIDVLLLGFGPDGHLASLFPGHPALDAAGVVTVVRDAPKPPPTRLSLTFAALETAARVVGVAAGAEKGAVLGRVRRGDGRLPIGRYLPRAVDWVVDADAWHAWEHA